MTKPAPIALDGLTYVSGAFQAAYDAHKATGWSPKGKVTISNLNGPSTLHVFLTDEADVKALTAIIAAGMADEVMLKKQRARDARVRREQAKFLKK
jgi:hypothetical protein